MRSRAGNFRLDSAREQIAQKISGKEEKSMRKIIFTVNERRDGKVITVLVTDRRDVALRCKYQCKLTVRFIAEKWEIV